MTQQTDNGFKTFTAGEALAAFRRVYISAADTVSYADATHNGIGVVQEAAASGDQVTVKLEQNSPGTMKMVAAGAVTALATVYGTADGKIDDGAGQGPAVGIALEAATADADIIEVLPIYGPAAPAVLNLPMGAWTEQDGTTLADFADADSATPGWNAGDESFGIRWNNKATSDPISCSVAYPADLDPGKDVEVHILAAKVGATVGDAVTFVVEAFENVPGALYDADTDFGDTSDAMTGDAATKTVQEVTVTLANADITGAPGVLTLTLQPTDTTLGTDDVIVLGVWLEYQPKMSSY